MRVVQRGWAAVGLRGRIYAKKVASDPFLMLVHLRTYIPTMDVPMQRRS